MPAEEVSRDRREDRRGLHDLHRQHVIHLDIKPQQRHHPRRTARRRSSISACRATTAARSDARRSSACPIGTAPYMAPEQVLRDPARPAQRSLRARRDAVFLRHRRAALRRGRSSCAACAAACGAIRVPPRALRPNCPPWLQEIILRCLEVEPAWRYPTAAQLELRPQQSGPGEADGAGGAAAARIPSARFSSGDSTRIMSAPAASGASRASLPRRRSLP